MSHGSLFIYGDLDPPISPLAKGGAEGGGISFYIALAVICGAHMT